MGRFGPESVTGFYCGDTRGRARLTAALVCWLFLTYSAALTGMLVRVDGWYAALNKPSWNPPNWVFGPVWTLLYGMMAVAAWLIWQRGGWRAQRVPLGLYLLQWLLNAAWTPLFFGLHRPDLAFAAIVTLLAAIVATLIAFRRIMPAAGWLLAPYALWTGFAAMLNFAIWQMN